jgi:hypothetical protein
MVSVFFRLMQCQWGPMVDQTFKSERAKLVRELADKTTDPFIKKRLLGLVRRYEMPERRPAPITPVELPEPARALTSCRPAKNPLHLSRQALDPSGVSSNRESGGGMVRPIPIPANRVARTGLKSQEEPVNVALSTL